MTPTFKKILMATDFGPESALALRTSASLARQLAASTHLLHVVKDPILAVSTPELYGIDWQRLRDDMVDQARQTLIARALSLPDLRVTTVAVVGSPAEAIANTAKEIGADLIVMGTHGRGGVGHLLIGSVAERVIRLASCPVMTVRGSGAVHVKPGEGATGEQTAAARVGR
jgi:nucleotide-binding universal stress UspA family protein